jgi:hemerythrin HHE cation binding domain-containing protein
MQQGDNQMYSINQDVHAWKFRSVVTSFALIISVALGSCAGTTANRSVASNSEGSANKQPTTSHEEDRIKLQVPSSIAAEHHELHEELASAIKSGGQTGDAAKIVEQRLSSHFEKEEEYALPQLGLLAPLAEGRVSPDMKPAIELSDRLKADMPKMLEEHKAIVEALNTLKEAAKAENKMQAISFSEKLSAHAQNEEQIMYPAAILVGEYLKLKLKQ